MLFLLVLILSMTTINSLLVIGLNPAYQRSIQLESLDNGAVNRGESVIQHQNIAYKNYYYLNYYLNYYY